jgi:hypothetical protein
MESSSSGHGVRRALRMTRLGADCLIEPRAQAGVWLRRETHRNRPVFRGLAKRHWPAAASQPLQAGARKAPRYVGVERGSMQTIGRTRPKHYTWAGNNPEQSDRKRVFREGISPGRTGRRLRVQWTLRDLRTEWPRSPARNRRHCRLLSEISEGSNLLQFTVKNADPHSKCQDRLYLLRAHVSGVRMWFVL